MRLAHTILAALLLLASVPATAAPADDFHTLLADHWAWYLKTDPITASASGVHLYDDRLPDISLAAMDRQAADQQAFLDRLARIPLDALSPPDRINAAIFRRLLTERIEGNRFGERMMLFDSYSSIHQTVAGLADVVPLHGKTDYESYLTRLSRYPALNAQVIAISRQAVAEGYVQPCAAMGGFEKTISGVITANPEDSRFYAPFKAPRPTAITPADWATLQARAKALITDVLVPEYRRFDAFYVQDYAPHCRKTIAATTLPHGKAWYAYQIRVMTTTDKTPEQIHALGLAEVARIRAEMDMVAKRAGYPSRAAFITKLRTDPRYFARSPEELMGHAALIAKTIDGKLPGFFGRLPRLPYGVRAIPAETAEGTTTAYYMPGSPDAGIAGTYYVNTSKLDQRPLWELPALTLHEAVPGHHNQIALQQELDLPEFRKHIVFYNAFVEGWALYAEHLGTEMGVYDTPEKDMGRLSYEMWRACRLVVDTGMHAMGWSREQAMAFMKENTALTDANIDAEVSRYISWPGQALAYKLGELEIRGARARAEAALGPKFDLRRFHDAVLGQGAVPLDLLDSQIDTWIAAEKARD
ncbi:DUF885 domain-containing protein [Flavisphingomonas formosensis]|uniref:DUF885 domain-containing protein n=1 Tax=Flavisphingomonas formosensis TaxID=861534 RepID=UPI0012FB93F6|nr:DUF885 domain-containing protein [Sphingomonas formosensis]